MNAPATADPFVVLGLPPDADEAEVRARYLERVKQFPPHRDPEKFREIRAAFEACKDPLSVARRLVRPPDDTIPQWSDAIAAQKRNPPRLTAAFVLSLGNRSPDDSRGAAPGRVERTPEPAVRDGHPQAPTDAS